MVFNNMIHLNSQLSTLNSLSALKCSYKIGNLYRVTFLIHLSPRRRRKAMSHLKHWSMRVQK